MNIDPFTGSTGNSSGGTNVKFHYEFHPISQDKLNPSFVNSSENERLYVNRFIEKYHITNYQVTPTNCGDSFEVLFEFSARTYLAEFKIRTFSADHFTSGLIEFVKYTGLTSVAYSLSAIPLYIMVYTNDIIRIWNLKRVAPEKIKMRFLPVDGRKPLGKKKWKLAGELPNQKSLINQL